MKHYHYSGRQQGQETTIHGWLMATDREDAVTQLRGRGVSPFNVRPGPGSIPLKVPVEELLLTLSELASLRRSGMAIDQSVQAVIETVEHKLLRSSWVQVLQMVRSGMSLSDAFAAAPSAFPRYAVPLIRLGEANGEIAEAIAIVAERLEEETKLKNDIKSAMTYPIFLLVISVAVVLFLFAIVIPKFGSMVASGAGSADGSMELLLAISFILREYYWVWLIAFTGLTTGFIYGWTRGLIQASVWRFFQRLPGLYQVIEAWEIVQFCSSMARLLPGGVSLLDALTLSGESLSRETIRQQLQNCADKLRRGETLGAAIKQEQVFPKLVVQMITVGEKSANLAGSMDEISKMYGRRMRDGIKRSLSLLEPAVIVTMGLLVGGIMVSLLSAIMTMNDIPL